NITKLIFQNNIYNANSINSLKSNNLAHINKHTLNEEYPNYKKNIESTSNPSTIIINNNININTYISKSYLPSNSNFVSKITSNNKYKNNLIDVNYNPSINYLKSDLLTSTNQKSSQEYIGIQGLTYDKDNIRKKID